MEFMYSLHLASYNDDDQDDNDEQSDDAFTESTQSTLTHFYSMKHTHCYYDKYEDEDDEDDVPLHDANNTTTLTQDTVTYYINTLYSTVPPVTSDVSKVTKRGNERKEYVSNKRRKLNHSTTTTISKVSGNSLIDMKSISDALCTRCCGNKCMGDMTAKLVRDLRREFLDFNGEGKMNYVLNKMREHRMKFTTSRGITSTKQVYVVDGEEVCRVAFALAHGIKDYRIRKAKGLLEAGTVNYTRAPSTRTITQNSDRCVAWLKEYIDTCGDCMPNSSEVRLHACSTWKELHYSYTRDVQVLYPEGKTVDYSHFLKLKNQNFPHVTLAPYTKLGKCDICIQIANDRRQTQNKVRLQEIKQRSLEHSATIKIGRQGYANRIHESVVSPLTTGSSVSDGATSPALPSEYPRSKSRSSLKVVEFGLQGYINHGLDYRDYVLIPPMWKKDANLFGTMLIQYYRRYASRGQLPRKQYMQSDNCVKDNKNNIMIGTMGLMVYKNWFDVIEMYNLPVGHTHIDIDQSYSTHSKYFRRNCWWNPWTINKDLNTIYSQDRVKPNILMQQQAYNLKQYFQGHLNKVTGITTVHAIKIAVLPNSTSRVPYIWYKFNAEDQDWQCHSDGSLLPVFSSVPDGDPQLLLPHYSVEVEVEDNVKKFFANKRMTQEDKHWWNQFFGTKGECLVDCTQPSDIWILPNQVPHVSESSPLETSELVAEVQQRGGLYVAPPTRVLFETYTCIYKEGRARARVQQDLAVIFKTSKESGYKVGRVLTVYSGEDIQVELYETSFSTEHPNIRCKRPSRANAKSIRIKRERLLYFNVHLNKNDNRVPAKTWKQIKGALSALTTQTGSSAVRNSASD